MNEDEHSDSTVRDAIGPEIAPQSTLPDPTAPIIPKSRPAEANVPPDSDRASDREDARAAYAAAVSLWTHEGELIWSRFNAMLVANSIVLAFIGFAADSSNLSPAVKRGMPIGGLILCALWLLLTTRALDYYTYWILSAREIEERHLKAVAKTVSRGGALAEGHDVLLEIDGKPVRHRMSRISRTFRVAWSTYAVIFTFAALYVLLLISG